MVTGFSMIGASILAGAATAATMSFASIAVGVIASAVVGAAIGGIAAAITGGDIGKGLLYGAIGGVVTGGIAGGVINGSLVTTNAAAMNVGSVNAATGLAESGYGQGLASAAMPKAIAPAVQSFGGAITQAGLTSMVAGKAIDFAAGAFAPEAQEDYRLTKESQDSAQASAERMNAANNSARSSGQGSGAQKNWRITKAGTEYEHGQAYGLQELAGSQATAKQNNEYKLANVNAQKADDRVRKKLSDAAGVAGAQEFQGSDQAAKDAVIAKQSALQGGK
jgi:hypothetical protein